LFSASRCWDHVCAGLRQSVCDCATDARGAADYDCYLAAEIQRRVGHRFPLVFLKNYHVHPKGLTNRRCKQNCVTSAPALRQVLFWNGVWVHQLDFPAWSRRNCSCFQVPSCAKYFACAFENGLTSSLNRLRLGVLLKPQESAFFRSQNAKRQQE